MVQEARELEAFLRGMEGQEALAKQAGDLAGRLEAAGLLSIKRRPSKVDLPDGLEGKVRRETITIGGKTTEQLKRELNAGGFRVSIYAEDLIDSKDFVTLEKPEDIELIFPRVSDLGLRRTLTTDQVYKRGLELGWSLCPAEVGPHLRLKDTDQPLESVYWIAMKQIAGRYGGPSVFGLESDGDGLWLSGGWAKPTGRWFPGDLLVFSLRK